MLLDEWMIRGREGEGRGASPPTSAALLGHTGNQGRTHTAQGLCAVPPSVTDHMFGLKPE